MPTAADLSGAVQVAIATTSTNTNQTVVKLNAAKAISPILNQAYGASYLAVSSSAVLVMGDGFYTSSSGQAVECFLLAIPRSSPAGQVRCLSTMSGTGPSGGGDGLWAQPMATRGSEVFFGVSTPSISVWHWDGVSAQVTQVTAAADYPYAADGQRNVCFHADSQTQLLCGDPSVGSYSFVNFPSSTTAFWPVGTNMVGWPNTFSLSTLSVLVTTGGAGGTPAARRFEPFGSSQTSDGGRMGSGGSTGIVKVSAPNRATAVARAGTSQWDDFSYVDPYAYGSNNAGQLFRIDPITLVVGTSNDYLKGTHFSSLTYVHAGPGDSLQVDAVDSSGNPTTVYVNVNTGTIQSTAPPGSVLQQVLPLQ